jgi:TolB-like protein
MAIWSSEIKELERLYESLRGQLSDLEKELERLVKADDENMILLYSRRCLEVIITDLCECELRRERGTEPLKGIIDKLNKEKKVSSHIITSMHGLNDLSTYGTHPKDFDPEQIKPVLNNLDIIIKWYLKYKETVTDFAAKPVEERNREIDRNRIEIKGKSIPRKKLAGILSGLIAIIVTVFAVLFFSKITGNGKQTKEIEKSIAVLPFKLLSDEPDKQYLADGMMDAITLHLSKIKDLRVMSRTSVEQYRNPTKTTNAIGRELDVEYLLEGSFQKFGDNVRLIVQLIKTGKEGHIWANKYDRNWSDIFSVQSEVAQKIADELNAAITPGERQLIEKIPTTNLTALDFYQRGREELGKFSFHDLLVTSTTYPIFFDNPTSKKSLQVARQMFKTALRYDTTFAPAYAELAAIYWSENYFSEYFFTDYLDSVLFLANKALSFDDQLADAYYIRGKYYGELGNIKQARKDFDKTVQLDPNYWMAYFGKGELYLEEFVDADYRVAIENFQNAALRYHGSALPYLLNQIAYVLRISGFDTLAKDYTLKAANLALDSAEYYSTLGGFKNLKNAYQKDSTDTNIHTLWDLASGYAGSGNLKESLKIYRKYLNRLKENGITMVNDIHRIGHVYLELGSKDSADYCFRKQIENCNAAIRLGRPYGMSFAYYDLVLVYASMGDKIKALEYLNIFKQREGMCQWFATALNWELPLRKFKNDPEFQKIFEEIDSKYQAEHERVAKWLQEQGML